ncbi:hypothetical protein B382_14418 [Stutzerimonas stutzeri B1SMN1]|nr:hypothetical protein B382_14418 [Stutzerimonas stutzeri B1SMN1]
MRQQHFELFLEPILSIVIGMRVAYQEHFNRFCIGDRHDNTGIQGIILFDERGGMRTEKIDFRVEAAMTPVSARVLCAEKRPGGIKNCAALRCVEALNATGKNYFAVA